MLVPSPRSPRRRLAPRIERLTWLMRGVIGAGELDSYVEIALTEAERDTDGLRPADLDATRLQLAWAPEDRAERLGWQWAVDAIDCRVMPGFGAWAEQRWPGSHVGGPVCQHHQLREAALELARQEPGTAARIAFGFTAALALATPSQPRHTQAGTAQVRAAPHPGWSALAWATTAAARLGALVGSLPSTSPVPALRAREA